MQLNHIKSITQPSDGIIKVTALCWAPNGKRLAVCTTERVVLMFDEDGVRKDKFFTKPADKVGSINIFLQWKLVKCMLNSGSQNIHREANDIFPAI